MKYIAIDPSINNIGVAIMNDGDLTTRTLSPTEKGKDYLMSFLRVAFRNVQCDVLICEYPNFQTSQRGIIAAQQGYTLNLAFVCGFVAAIIDAKKVVMATPTEWKGQTPKHIIGARYTQWTGEDFNEISDHEYEAAMMIEWYIRTGGRLLVNKR